MSVALSPMFLGRNRDDDLIKVPLSTRRPADRLWFRRQSAPELLCPETHGLVRDDDFKRRQQIFDHLQTEWKTKIQPHGVGNHFSWKPVAAINALTSDLDLTARSHRPIAES